MKTNITLLVSTLVLVFAAGIVPGQTPTQTMTREQSRLLAKRAAILDAQRNLAETIYGLRIDSRTTVRNFITENDTIRTRVNTILKGARVTDTRYERDGTCTVKMEVPVAALQRVLRRRFAYTSDVIRATGHGAPNPVPEGPVDIILPSPNESWHMLVIKATGSGTAPPEMADTAQGKLMAERAAYADALRQLGENIKGVHVTSRTTVRNFITQNDEIKTRFESFLRGAKRVETRHLEDGICEVDLEIPLEGLQVLFNPPPTPTPPRSRTRKYRR